MIIYSFFTSNEDDSHTSILLSSRCSLLIEDRHTHGGNKVIKIQFDMAKFISCSSLFYITFGGACSYLTRDILNNQELNRFNIIQYIYINPII